MVKINGETYKELRLILENQYGQTFTIEEVKEVGNGLVDFFEVQLKLSKETGSSQK